jgi:hypothetical protein
MTNRTHIWIVLGLLIALALLGGIMQRMIPPRIDLPFETQSTILAAEFASMPDEIVTVLGATRNYAEPLKRAQYLDFPFIVCYVALFVLLGLALRNYDIPTPRGLSWTVIVCSVLAGIFDIAENVTILRTIANPVAFNSHVRWFSLPKWGLVFFVMMLLSILFLFWPRLVMWWRLAAVSLGLFFMFVGGAGLLFTFLTSVGDIGWAANLMGWAMGSLLVFMAGMGIRLRYWH